MNLNSSKHLCLSPICAPRPGTPWLVGSNVSNYSSAQNIRTATMLVTAKWILDVSEEKCQGFLHWQQRKRLFCICSSQDNLKVWRNEKKLSLIYLNKQLMLWSIIIRKKRRKKPNTLFSIRYVNGRLGWPTVHNLAKQLIPNFNIYIWLLLQKWSTKTKHRRAHNRHTWTLKA